MPKPGYVEPAKAKGKAKREPKEKAPAVKIDPKYLAAAREFRDGYLERVNASPDALPAPAARYDVSRTLPATGTAELGHESHESSRIVASQPRNPRRQLPSAA